MHVASKKFYWKNQSVPNTCAILPLKKKFYQNLTVNRLIFQIHLKYIKLVIPKILFMVLLCSFNFYFKIIFTFIGNPGDGEKFYPTTKNLPISLIRKIPYNRSNFFAVLFLSHQTAIFK